MSGTPVSFSLSSLSTSDNKRVSAKESKIRVGENAPSRFGESSLLVPTSMLKSDSPAEVLEVKVPTSSNLLENKESKVLISPSITPLITDQGDCFEQLEAQLSVLSDPTRAATTCPFSEAEQLFYRGTEKHPIAEVDALYLEGIRYRFGYKGPADYKKAFTRFKTAMDQGHLRASYYVACMLTEGQGTLRDSVAATTLYKTYLPTLLAQASGQADAWAIYTLVSLFNQGNGWWSILYNYDNKKGIRLWDQMLESRRDALLLKEAALKGVVAAMFALGKVYRREYGEYWKECEPSTKYNSLTYKRQKERANTWYFAAAHQGFASAQAALGDYYASVCGENNFTKAVPWYQKAASQGYAEAQFELGIFYLKDKKMPVDQEHATYWLNKAAKQDFGAHKFYGEASLFFVDNKEAEQFLRWAAEQALGYPDAEWALAFRYHYDEVKGEDPQLRRQKAAQLYQKLVDRGHVEGFIGLGDLHKENRLPKPGEHHLVEAVKWYRKAADQGSVLAQCDLGDCYRDNQGVPLMNSEARDREAVKWYKMATEQKETNLLRSSMSASYSYGAQTAPKRKATCLARAQFNLASLYMAGLGVTEVDIQVQHAEAMALYQKASDLGYAPAQFELGRAHELGRYGAKKDSELAKSWYKKAAKQDHAGAKFHYAHYCFWGIDSDVYYLRNTKTARSWYHEAAQQGFDPEMFYLKGEALGKRVLLGGERAEYFFDLASGQPEGHAKSQAALFKLCIEQGRPAFKPFTTTRRLDLSRQGINDVLLRCLVKWLRENKCLTHLNLSHNAIEGGATVIELIVAVPNLRICDLSHNRLSDSDVRAWADKLRADPPLETLLLLGNVG